ncbi:MAG: succinate dehydrogenase cytochrome b subunit [Proteobacteria bacterium]|nr:succinate dehydrogenase cytochrome b subunit [Pseudomonadota bacterium]
MALCDRIIGNGVGAKAVVAITGLMLTGFVMAHLSGNLLVFAGPEAFNKYAAGLKSLGGILWVARLGLLGIFILHLGLAIRLNLENKAARPQKYVNEATMEATFASRYMVQTGLLLFAFIIYHLAHYTFRVASDDVNAVPAEDVYGMVIAGFSNPIVSGFYVLAMAALAMHLKHGVSSAFQSLGIYHPNLNVVTQKLGPIIAAIVFVGFASIPVSVLMGCIK